MPETHSRPRVCAVSYLNTAPLVWGMLHGPQRDCFDLSFALPAECADRLENRSVDIGLVPCAELRRLQLSYLPDVGIACRGPVRSILLITRTEPGRIRTLAADSSSRTSVQLARIVLERRHGATPHIVNMGPNLSEMLDRADGALIIGDPALRIDPAALPFRALDLGAEWVELTGLPMVFAVWAGPDAQVTVDARGALLGSYLYGRSRIGEIAGRAPEMHGIPAPLACEYLTRHIVFELGEPERRGLSQFLEWC